MAQMLLINPAKRRKPPSAAQKRARAAFAAAARARRKAPARKRRASRRVAAAPAPARRRARRASATPARRRSRRVGGGGGFNLRTIQAMLVDGALGGAGAVLIEAAQGYANPYLPEALRTQSDRVSAGDAVKAAATVALGIALSRVTRGASRKMAAGALAVQARDILRVTLADALPMGFASPARTIPGTARVGPGVRGNVRNIAAFMAPGSRSPMLNASMAPGSSSPLLSNSRRVMQREGVLYR